MPHPIEQVTGDEAKAGASELGHEIDEATVARGFDQLQRFEQDSRRQDHDPDEQQMSRIGDGENEADHPKGERALELDGKMRDRAPSDGADGDDDQGDEQRPGEDADGTRDDHEARRSSVLGRGETGVVKAAIVS